MPTNSKKRSVKKNIVTKIKQRYAAFMARRPHRSFRVTSRRDAVRPLELPGVISFTHEVNKTLWRYRKLFLFLTFIYMLLYGILVGVQSQDTFTDLSQGLREVGAEMSDGEWGVVDQAGALFVSIATAGTDANTTEAQQIFAVLIFLLVWLTTVWLLRNLLAGHKVKLRDGLYNAGAPIFATMMILLLIAIQLIPVVVAIIGYSAASTSGLLVGGAEAMLFWLAASLLGIMSLYWITSSLLALIIVTIPGVYPYKAVRAASELVLGRRVRILLRWVWMTVVVAVAWLLVIIPAIFLDIGLKSVWPALEWVPILPVTLLVLGACTIVWVSTYVYLLYRKIVDYEPK